MKEAIEEFENDSSAYVAVLYGTGGNFCSGFDFQELANIENSSEISFENGLMVINIYR